MPERRCEAWARARCSSRTSRPDAMTPLSSCRLNAWDAMAGLLLIEEAGGYTAPFPGAAGLRKPAPVMGCAPGDRGRDEESRRRLVGPAGKPHASSFPRHPCDVIPAAAPTRYSPRRPETSFSRRPETSFSRHPETSFSRHPETSFPRHPETSFPRHPETSFPRKRESSVFVTNATGSPLSRG